MRQLFFVHILMVGFSLNAWPQDNMVPAFPEAEGFGAFTQGGRGGKVYVVSTTEDYAGGEGIIPGSLREAVNAEGPRIIVFRVSGTICLKEPLSVKNPFITIAGQTAPGEGICLKDDQFSVAADEVIVRHIRFRPGDARQRDLDAISVRGENIIFDHCSAGWSIDENFSAYSNSITIQNCIISEGLNKSFHPKGIHSMGSILNGQYGGISLLYNIYAHNNSRNPVVQNVKVAPGAIFEIRNNIIYNWGGTPCYVSGISPVRVNMVGNYFKPGPSSSKSSRNYAFSPNENTRLFIADNHHTENEAANHNNWLMVKRLGRNKEIEEKRVHPFPHPPVASKKGQEIYEQVLNHAGAVLPIRDAVDRRIVGDVRMGTGELINSQNDVGGWPEYSSKKGPKDKDLDGMPDTWEKKSGLDPNDYSDHKNDADDDGYTNIEEFLNSTDPRNFTSGKVSHPEFLKVLAYLDSINIDDYKRVEEKEARRLAELENRSFPELNVQIDRVPGDKQERIELLIEGKVKILLNLIPAGTFLMGSPEDEPGREEGETLHKVTLSRSYYMGITEITNQQFSEVVRISDGKSDQFPAKVSRHDADWFCEILSQNTKFNFRLPTEAEWEYACRAGTTTAYFTGESITVAHANFNAQVEGMKVGIKEVASVKPNPWGLYDMPGNEFEWCSDWEGAYPGGDVTDPSGPLNTKAENEPRTTSRNIIRGGNYSSSWKYVRSAYRYDYTPHVPYGFRLVLEVPEESK